MENDKKLAFVHKMTKMGLQHFDSGGGVISPGTNPSVGTDIATGGLSLIPQGVQGIAGGLTAQNTYQATAPDISAETTNYNNANNVQNSLEAQLQAQANGTGPNPALSQLNQTTNTNNNSAASIAASKRGLNPAQATRLGQQSSINNNQAAAGQAATLGAQQQLAAEGELGTVAGQQENAASGFGGTVNQGTLGAEGINAQVSQNNANSVNQTEGGILGSAGAALGLAKGGMVPMKMKKMADGGKVPDDEEEDDESDTPAPFSQNTNTGSINTPYAPKISGPASKGPSSGVGQLLSGVMGSGGGADAAAALMKSGGKVKPQAADEKATVKGDSLKNDKVPAMLSSGEIVIPRHITMAQNAPEKAAEFVRMTMAKKGFSK